MKVDGDTNSLEMLVIAHQEDFTMLRRFVFRFAVTEDHREWVAHAEGLVLVYGCDKRASFERLEDEWVKLAVEVKGVQAWQIPKILVCNKVDLPISERLDGLRTLLT